ncbi:MAG: HAD family phosphatase [Promethearchaeota archaeon]|nr:MAG: HAD family phosphatase [Candidatus Lokiarchaeota archaeon]
MKIKCVIFDLGDVIVDLDFSRFFNEVITPSPLNKPPSSIYLEFFRQSDIYHQGKITDEEFFKLSSELLEIGNDLTQSHFFEAFNSIISDLNDDVVDIVKQIKEYNPVKIMCLSNINASHWKYLKKQNWDIWQIIDEFILSHEIQMTKPDPDIFRYAIRKARCKPKEIVFIDDGLNNIRAALELGFNCIRFTNSDNLVTELKKLGFKLEN